MNCIELMVDEHKYIKRMLSVIRKHCNKILNGENVRYEDFFKVIDFVRNYADKHHHGKEEALLFERMTEELGPAADKLVRLGMNVEHDLGRLHISELEAAVKRVLEGDSEARLDVIANAISYTHLLNRHIDKEDGVVYKYARNNLSKETMERLENECKVFEQKAREEKIQEKYIGLLGELESQA
ncbi:MAG TPA: hemerythrin domain-containing protein [Pseudobacteroides sp.]|uniref:hemerythrin domain-containing protein n=1 Tax=Pseudobacteroides sp. TaxID=1968840 RepID=UPI002F93DCDB